MSQLRTWTTKSGITITRILAGRSNVFLVSSEDKHALVDTSPAFMWPVLKKRLQNLGIEKIDYLVLTHAHFDHAANAEKIKKHFHTHVIVHKSDAHYLKEGKNPVVYGTNRILYALSKVLAPVLLRMLTYAPCEPDIIIESDFELKDFNMKLIHTPGHTDGSISVIVDDEIALVGDTMLGVFRNSVFIPFAINIEQLLKSWGKLVNLNCKTYIPSHGKEQSYNIAYDDFIKRKAQFL